jgi:peptidoglycan/xylan/chitin deacetylase (PgdA/CDA1 family)
MNTFLKNKILGFFVKTNGIFSAPLFAGRGIIFMLHRVLPEKERAIFSLTKGLAISPEKLEEFVITLKNKGYQFFSLDEISACFENNVKLPKKFICFTLDDGYKDNLVYGLPIFKKYQVPFTLYITNCFPNGTAILWWYLFENHAKFSNELVLSSSFGKIKFSWENETEAFNQFTQVSEAIKSIPATELKSVLSIGFGLPETEFEKQCKSVTLSWDEIIQLSKEPLVTIGAHTMNHVSVKQQATGLAKEEIQASKLEIERYINKEVCHFAYPFGGAFDVDSETIEIVKKVGYKTATLNQPGNIFKSNKHSKFALARLPLGNRVDGERMNYYLNGIYHFSVNGFIKNLY